MPPTRLLLTAWGLALPGACHPNQPPTTAPPVPPAAAVPARAPRPDPVAPHPLSPALHHLIQQHVAGVNAVREWSAVETQPLEGGEGGDATYYDLHGQLLKVTAHRLGETGQALAEYYLLHGRPAFVLEQLTSYNRPIYYTEQVRREAHDTEAFDPAKSTTMQTRSYFDATGRLVAQTGPSVRDSVGVVGYLAREQRRLGADLDSLRKLPGRPNWRNPNR